MQDKAPPVMPTYVKDALVDTSHLPGDVFKALWVLTWKAWAGVEGMPAGHLPGDDGKLQEMSCLQPREWRRARERVLGMLAKKEDGSYYSKRSLRELEKIMAVREARAESGQKGAAKRWQTDSKRHGKDLATEMANGMAKNDSSSASSSALASASLPPAPPPPPECARANGGGLGIYPTADLAEAAFKVFLSKYPPEGVPSAVAAERAWSEALPWLPPLGELLAALERHKRSDQWQRGKVHGIERWLRERMWTGKLGEASEQTRYRPFEGA